MPLALQPRRPMRRAARPNICAVEPSAGGIRPAGRSVGGEGGTSYVLRTSEVKIRFLSVAIPDPVFKYFSRSRAVHSSLTAIYASSSRGRRDFVDWD